MARLNFVSDSSRWAAVASRNSEADQCFVYCVKTTKIFCRPICQARLPRRSNVEFYDGPAQAEAAGYRACKRCQPNLQQFIPKSDKMIRKVITILDELTYGAPIPSLESLAQEAGMTKFHFHRSFKKITGMTPRGYALSKQRYQSMTSPPLAEKLQVPTPSLNDDVSAVSFDVGTPNDTDNGIDTLPAWDFAEWDDLIRFGTFEWQDLQNSGFDACFGNFGNEFALE